MTAHAPIPCDPKSSAEALRGRWLDLQLETLGRLAEVGLRIAEAIGDQAQTVAADPGGDDALTARTTASLNACAMGYARVARAVRMTLALQSRLLQPAAEKPSADKTPEEPVTYRFRWMEDPAAEKETQRTRVRRLVRRVAEDALLDREVCERLEREAAERLVDEDLYGDPTQRPIGDILAHICRDLGLDPDWGRLSQEPWAKEEIQAGDPASPFRAWMGQPPPDRAPGGPLSACAASLP